MAVSISDYDDAERRAVLRASYPAIRAFRPAAFTLVNFPVRITDESELVRYSDIMNELTDRDLYYCQKLFSKDEAALMIQVAARVAEITGRLGRSVQPFMAMFPPISMLRVVVNLAAGRPLSILEIGPGSGYLGAYILSVFARYGDLPQRTGFRYHAVDNAQALYLWQSRLFGSIEEDFIDYALSHAPPTVLTSRASMTPWWLFAEMYKRPPSFDIVICDAALGEMDSFAANYVIRLAALVLKESPIGAFLFRHIGEQRMNPLSYIESRFQSAGFSKQTLGEVIAYSLRPLPESVDRPLGSADSMEHACSFFPIDRKKILDSYAFFDFLALRS